MRSRLPVFAEMMERITAAALLLALSPLLLLISIGILLESGLPIFFRQERVGQYGTPFHIVKLRSMRMSSGGRSITSSGDLRVTRMGALLRKYKLDEVPQLWNIIVGEMRFIGPRPEVSCFVEHCEVIWKEVLQSKPGLTDPSSLVYRNEESLLSQYKDAETAYRTEILPRKLELSAHYLRRRCILSDCRLLLWTLRYSLFPTGFDAGRLRKRFIEG